MILTDQFLAYHNNCANRPILTHYFDLANLHYKRPLVLAYRLLRHEERVYAMLVPWKRAEVPKEIGVEEGASAMSAGTKKAAVLIRASRV